MTKKHLFQFTYLTEYAIETFYNVLIQICSIAFQNFFKVLSVVGMFVANLEGYVVDYEYNCRYIYIYCMFFSKSIQGYSRQMVGSR